MSAISDTHQRRADDLLRQMTVEEKAGQLNLLHGLTEANPQDIRDGMVTGYLLGPPPGGNPDFSWAAEVNRAQRIAVTESRLGIPLLMARDVIHGHRTVFPIPLGQAAGFDPELVRRAAEVAAREASAQGVRWNYSPMVDIARDPRWGRIAEGYGEDPTVAARMGAAAIAGYQGDDLSRPDTMAACVKHFATYGACRAGIDYESAELGDRAVREVYLPPFRAAVHAGVASLMPALHDLNGVPLHAHVHLLRDVLRNEWGFDGLVTSDWTAVSDLLNHRVAASEEDAVLLAFAASVDMDMVAGLYRKHIPRLIQTGALSEESVNHAVRRVLVLKSRLGLFENPYVEESRETTDILCPEHLALAKEAAYGAAVLLENKAGVLPLKKDYQALAVVGPLAESRAELLGTWCLDGRAEDTISIAHAIRQALTGSSTRVISDANLHDAALAHSMEAEAVVLVIGEHPTRSGEAASVTDISLPPGQLDLAEKLAETGVPLIVVVLGGRPLALERLRRLADALLFCFHPGTMGGRAIADILFGDAEPAGRLPVTFPRSTGHIPTYHAMRSTGRPSKRELRYTARYADASRDPLYRFGYGLSYGEMVLSEVSLSTDSLSAGQTLTVRAVISNVSNRETSELVCLYLRDEVRSVAPPEEELRHFTTIKLKPGETTTVTFQVGEDELSFIDASGNRRIEPGAFSATIRLGAGTGVVKSFEVVASGG